MRKPVRALYIILMCTVLLVLGTGVSNDSQDPVFGSDSDESLFPTWNKNMNLMSEFSDTKLENSIDFVPEDQLVSTWTNNIDIRDYMLSPSDNSRLYDYDIEQLMVPTEQTDTPSYSYITLNHSVTEYSLAYCISNESEQEYTKPESIQSHHQPSKPNKLELTMEENTPRKKQKKSNESTASSLEEDSLEDDLLDNRKIKTIKRNISTWNNAKLNNRHRESLYPSYKPAVEFDKIGNNKYKEIGDEKHQSLIETHVEHCKAVYSERPVQNEFWFSIASRTSCMHTKLADCQAMNKNPSGYKFIKGLSGYYPGLPGYIVRYMDEYGPIVSKQESIKTEWNETIGDIYVRELIEPGYGIDKKIINYETNNKYRPMAIAVRMILALPEVHKDLSTISVKFIEKTLENETDSNHLAVVRSLHEIVEKKKMSKESEIDNQYIILYNAFKDILHQTNASPKSIVIRLYTEMYRSLVYFYEKAEVCEEILDIKKRKDGRDKEYYLLAGKCIIKPQRYLKCTTTINLNKKDMGEYKHQITEETNKWSIPSDIKKHYHIHYVDNTKQKYTRVCMPMCSDENIHTINQTVEYLKILFEIEKEECICPYKRNRSGYWEYIQEKERDKTVDEFVESDIVFYYIEEGIRDDYFTFAEFESYKRPKGKTVHIPLFLSPLMRSAVSMGPFKEQEKIKHEVISNMQCIRMWPSIYTYNPKYRTIAYSHVHHYYSNLYIQRDNADVETIDCYLMNSKEYNDNGIVTVQWHAKVPNGVDEYTHCIVSDELINDQDKYDKFSKAVKTQEYTPDSAFYGFGLKSSLEKTSGLNGVKCSTEALIDPNSITNCKLNVVPIHKTLVKPIIADLQSEIDELDKKIKHIEMKINKSGTTEELRNERKVLYKKKSKNKKKIKKIHLENQPLIEEEFSATPLPLCSFLVFRHSNTQIKSGLGAHNEILNAFTRRYNSH